jgi:hypothetical protein
MSKSNNAKKVVFFRNHKVERPEPITSLANIKSLKEIEFSKDNFQDIPTQIYITNIMDPQSVSFRRPNPEDNNGEYKGYAEEDIPYVSANFGALSYDKLENLKMFQNEKPEMFEAIKNELREFKVSIKNDKYGVGQFHKVIETARKRAEGEHLSEDIERPALLLKGCDFAFIPKWEMMGKNGQYKGVDMILRSIEGLEIIEEPAFETDASEEQSTASITDLFD